MKSVVNASPRPLWKKLALTAVICLVAALLVDIPGKMIFRVFFQSDAARALDTDSFIWSFMTWVRNGPPLLLMALWQLLNILLMWEFFRHHTDLSWKGYGLYWLVQLGIILACSALHMPLYKVIGAVEVLTMTAGSLITLLEVFCLLILFQKKLR